MSTTHTTNRRASPLRVLQRIGWRFRAPGSPVPILATEVMDEQLAKTEADITAAHAEAIQIETGLEATRHAMSVALCDAHTPGVITQCEARAIARTLVDTSVVASTHAKRLGAML